MLSEKRWELKPPPPPELVASLPELPPLLIRLLHNRGLSDPAQIRAFLEGGGPGNPFRLQDIHRAVDRLRRAIRQDEPIAVYGDFDVDGITATVLLVETLQALGAQVRSYIPSRLHEGYGLNFSALRRLAGEGVRVVVTVDCGIRSIREVAYGQRLGLDMIITDHHSIGPELPPAFATINPKRSDCPYPFKKLSGVGVAYKLAQALLRVERQVPVKGGDVSLQEENLLDLVALGTVADIVPIFGENRDLVRQGLKLLNVTPRPGLRALAARAGVKMGQINTYMISYVLGPRLNAAGRLAEATLSYKLLTSRSPEEAEPLAQELEEQNRQRQRLTDKILAQAREQVLETGPEASLLVAIGENFLAGVVGLVANHLSEEFYRPALVIERGQKRSRGSARSIPEFHITRALDRCRELLVRHGGHAAAAGFTVENENLPAFLEKMRLIADEELKGLELKPTLEIDAELCLSELTWDTYYLLKLLEPCGEGNPPPLLLSRGVLLRETRRVGAENKHLKLTLSDGKCVWDAIAFRQGARADEIAQRLDVVYRLEADQWNDEPRLQLKLEDWRPAL